MSNELLARQSAIAEAGALYRMIGPENSRGTPRADCGASEDREGTSGLREGKPGLSS